MRHLLLFLVLATGSLVAAAQQLTDSVQQQLNKIVNEFREKNHIPGIALALVHDNEIVYSQALGYTDLEKKTPVTSDSRFPIMSVTKTFTATMLMQLVEKGTVQLQDKVSKYVPEYKVQNPYPGSGATTLLQLASHTAGLPRNSPADLPFIESADRWVLTNGKQPMGRFSTDEALLASLKDVKLEYPPYHFISYNDRHYSNLGMSVLGIALQRAAKTDWASYIVKNICQPLQMKHSGVLTEPGVQAKIAKGYRFNKTTAAYDQTPAFVPNSALYAGGMYSTVSDLSKYISFQFVTNDAQTAKVLSTDSRAMMRFFKIGWKPAYPYVTHEGAIPGYRSMAAFNPDARVGWVILTNGNDVNFNEINNAFSQVLAAAYKKGPVLDLAKYAGTYSLPQSYGSITVTLKNDSLYSTYLADLLGNKPMIPDGAARFKTEANGHTIWYEFIGDDKGTITALRFNQLIWDKKQD